MLLVFGRWRLDGGNIRASKSCAEGGEIANARAGKPDPFGGQRNNRRLEHDPEKCIAVFGKDHAKSKN
jgi:hypothetical protein